MRFPINNSFRQYVKGWPAYIGELTIYSLRSASKNDPDEERFTIEGPIALLPNHPKRFINMDNTNFSLDCYLRGYGLSNVRAINDLQIGCLVYVSGFIERRISQSDFINDDEKWKHIPGAFCPHEVWIDYSAGRISPNVATFESSIPLNRLLNR